MDPEHLASLCRGGKPEHGVSHETLAAMRAAIRDRGKPEDDDRPEETTEDVGRAGELAAMMSGASTFPREPDID